MNLLRKNDLIMLAAALALFAILQGLISEKMLPPFTPQIAKYYKGVFRHT